MEFDNFIGIDWSGDKSKFQKGISVAQCEMGNSAPKIIKSNNQYWSRTTLFEWLIKEENFLITLRKMTLRNTVQYLKS
jgi:hypothetical protein